MFIEANDTLEKAIQSKRKSTAAGYVMRISLTAALAGFIFGFDTVVISGANLPIKELWHTSPWFHGFFYCRRLEATLKKGKLENILPHRLPGKKLPCSEPCPNQSALLSV